MQYSRWLSDDSFVLFLFHGVVRTTQFGLRNYTRKHLPLDYFVRVLDDLLEHGTAVSMEEIVAASTRGHSLPPRAFSVTFDDGFANNYTIAAPVLSERAVPATFYVTTGFVERNLASWVDQIEYAFERKSNVRLRLPIAGFSDRTAVTLDEQIRLLDEVRQIVKSDRSIDPYALAADIAGQLGVVEMEPHPELDQKMTWHQVKSLSADRLFTIGGHGETHRILEFLDTPALEREVSGSVRTLRQKVSPDISHYSYPEGLANCYSDRVIALLQQHRVICAPTAQPGSNSVGDDLFRLRRIAVI